MTLRAALLLGATAALAACGPPPEPVAPPAVRAEPAERPLEEPLLLMGSLGSPSFILADGADVYVLDDEDVQIWRVKRDGTAKRRSVGVATASFAGAALDADFVYYATNGEDAEIVRLRKDGRGTRKVLVGDVVEPGPIAVDDRWLYYTTDGEIHRIRKDGSGTPVTLATDEYPSDLLVVGEDLWWTTGDYGQVNAVPRQGSAEPRTIAEDLSLPTRLVADATHVYWSDPSAGVIARVSRAGGAAEIVLQVPGIDDLAVDGRDVYWTDGTSGTISRVPKEGGQPYTLFWNLQQPTRLLVDEEGLIYLHTGYGALIRRPKAQDGRQKNMRRAISK